MTSSLFLWTAPANYQAPSSKLRAPAIAFDTALTQLQALISAKILPSLDRIRELFSVCRQNNEKAKVVCCVADILRLEEEFPCDTPSDYKPILILLSSTSSLQ